MNIEELIRLGETVEESVVVIVGKKIIPDSDNLRRLINESVLFLKSTNLECVEIKQFRKNSTLQNFEDWGTLHIGIELSKFITLRSIIETFPKKQKSAEPLQILEKLFSRFHAVANTLKKEKRHTNRETLEIKDEYDVQDLLFALLQIEFKNIKGENNVPDLAGKNSRYDFYLENEKILIEVKNANKNLTDKALFEQFKSDVPNYSTLPGCEHIVFFIYDPEGNIKNPAGLIEDTNKLKGIEGTDIPIKTFIGPTSN